MDMVSYLTLWDSRLMGPKKTASKDRAYRNLFQKKLFFTGFMQSVMPCCISVPPKTLGEGNKKWGLL